MHPMFLLSGILPERGDARPEKSGQPDRGRDRERLRSPKISSDQRIKPVSSTIMQQLTATIKRSWEIQAVTSPAASAAIPWAG